jgi:hypothetical protein
VQIDRYSCVQLHVSPLPPPYPAQFLDPEQFPDLEPRIATTQQFPGGDPGDARQEL